MLVFTNIETIEARIKQVDGGDANISDSTFVNHVKKWYAPIEQGTSSGSPTFLYKKTYDKGLTLSQNAYVGGKPFMFTKESGKIIAYTLDYLIPVGAQSPSIGGPRTLVINSDLNNDGNDMIHRLDGGELEESSAGTSWTTTDDDGTVLSPIGNPVLTDPPMSVEVNIGNPNRFPCPFLQLKRPSS